MTSLTILTRRTCLYQINDTNLCLIVNYALEPPLMVSSLQRPLSCPGGQSIQRLLFKPPYNGNGHYSVPNHPLSLNSGHFFKQPMNSENQDSSCRFLIAVSRLSIPYLFWYEPFFFFRTFL